MRLSIIAFVVACMLNPMPASAGLFDGASAVSKQMTRFIGRPAQELVDALGDATDQKQVLDNIVISGGFDSDEGPSCTWKIVVDKEKIVKDVSVFGNAWGCGPVAKNLKRWAKEHSIPER